MSGWIVPETCAPCCEVLYLVFNEGYSGDVDLAAEAIRLARQLAAATDDAEVAGLLALFLLHHARRPARTRADGSLVPLADQDRGLWRRDLIAEGVAVLQAALARDRLGSTRRRPRSRRCTPTRRPPTRPTGRRSSSGTTSSSALTDSPVVRLNRAVAVGEADGPQAGLAALAELDPTLPAVHRLGRLPPRAGRRHRHGGGALRRGRRTGADPRRAQPPHAASRHPPSPPLRHQ